MNKQFNVFTEGITLDEESHTYNLGNDYKRVASVTNIIRNSEDFFENNAMLQGRAAHSCLEEYINHHFLGKNIATYSNHYELLDDSKKTLVNEIGDYLVKNHSNSLNKLIETEQAFIVNQHIENGNVLFGGTADAVTESTIIEFKTGDYYKHYDYQVAAYAKALNKKNAIILYQKDGKLISKSFNSNDLTLLYTSFLTMVKRFYNKYETFDYYLLEELKKYEHVKQSIEHLESISKKLKSNIATMTSESGMSKYCVQNYTVFEVKGKTSTTLKADAKLKLLESNPDYFDTKISKPFTNIRISRG